MNTHERTNNDSVMPDTWRSVADVRVPRVVDDGICQQPLAGSWIRGNVVSLLTEQGVCIWDDIVAKPKSFITIEYLYPLSQLGNFLEVSADGRYVVWAENGTVRGYDVTNSRRIDLDAPSCVRDYPVQGSFLKSVLYYPSKNTNLLATLDFSFTPPLIDTHSVQHALSVGTIVGGDETVDGLAVFQPLDGVIELIAPKPCSPPAWIVESIVSFFWLPSRNCVLLGSHGDTGEGECQVFDLASGATKCRCSGLLPVDVVMAKENSLFGAMIVDGTPLFGELWVDTLDHRSPGLSDLLLRRGVCNVRRTEQCIWALSAKESALIAVVDEQ